MSRSPQRRSLKQPISPSAHRSLFSGKVLIELFLDSYATSGISALTWIRPPGCQIEAIARNFDRCGLLKEVNELAYSAGLDGTRLTISVVFFDTTTQDGRVDLSNAREWSEVHFQEQCLRWWCECAAMHMLTLSTLCYWRGSLRWSEAD